MSSRANRKPRSGKPAPHTVSMPGAPPAGQMSVATQAPGVPSIQTDDGPPATAGQPPADSYPMTEGEHQMLVTLIDRESGALKDLGQLVLEILRVWPRLMELANGAQTAKNEQITLARKMATDRGIPLDQPGAGQWNVNPAKKMIERIR